MKMKKLLTLLSLALLGHTQAQTLEESLTPILQKLDTTKTLSVLYASSAQLDLLAAKYPDQWIANYFASYAKVRVSYVESNIKKKDLILDEAEKYFEKQQKLRGDSSEKYVLAAFVANGRLAVDGQNRWKTYGPIFEENLKKAKELNESNPRIYYLKGISVFYTPKMFGGGKNNAESYFEKAKGFYDKESKASSLVPHWGDVSNADFLKQCKE